MAAVGDHRHGLAVVAGKHTENPPPVGHERYSFADRESHHGAVGPHLAEHAETLAYPVEQVMKLVLGALVDVDGHGQLPAADHAGADTWPGCRFLACAAPGTPVVINIRMIASGISRLTDRDLAGENLLRLLLGLVRGRKEWRAGCLERLIDLPATVHALPASRAYTATISVGGLGPTF